MSEVKVSLCSILLKEYFGEIVQSVGTFLLKQVSSCPLRVIVFKTALPLEKVKSALCVLIQHNFGDYTLNERRVVEYSVSHEKVLLLIYYPRYVYCAQSTYGDIAELLVEEILNNGRLTMSDAIRKVMDRLQDSSEYSSSDVRSRFISLVEKQFLCRCPYSHISESKSCPNMLIEEHEMYIVPEIKLHLLESNGNDERPAKKQKTEYPDADIYWRANHIRFHKYFRDQAIITACNNSIDDKAADIVKTVLLLSEQRPGLQSPTTVPIPRHEILEAALKITNIDQKEFDPYLSILTEGTQSFMSKADDRSGGMFVVNVDKVLGRIVESIAQSVVQDRFGSKCCRIFRLLQKKKYLEQKQIEELSMVQPKDAKEYTYRMFEENFILTQDIPKTPEYTPARMFYLFHVDMNQVCRMLLERCYKAIGNAMLCSETHNKENKRLLEKKQRVDAIVANLKQSGAEDAQIEEVQQMITPPEDTLLKKVLQLTAKLDMSQIQLAEMVLILTDWIETTMQK